jgi:hypothetical protein
MEPQKMLSPAQTRWLSLQACVARLLEQYEALKHYLILVANDDPSNTNDRILASLHNRFTQAYLEFLSFQRERLNGFNRLFQSELPLLHHLKREVEQLVKELLVISWIYLLLKKCKQRISILQIINSIFLYMKFTLDWALQLYSSGN